jgi:hypothetical protein
MNGTLHDPSLSVLTVNITAILDGVHCPEFFATQHFGNWAGSMIEADLFKWA